MRRSGGSPSRYYRLPKSAVLAASVVLLLLAVLAIAAQSAGSTGPLSYPLERELLENYEQAAITPEKSAFVGDPAYSLLGLATRVPLSGLTQTSALSPSLQPNVLSTFRSSPVPALAADRPEQTAFVQGYQQLEPVLSATSYIPLSHKPTRGIILPAGKSLRLGSAYVTLQLLRDQLSCDLPVEIWHVPGEIDDHTKAVFETTFADVMCRDATSAPYPSHHKQANIRGFALKAFALYATSFTEVILLDADNLPVLDPSLLLEAPEYKLHGSMFWPDLFAQPLSRVSGILAAAYNLLGWKEPWAAEAIGNSSFMFAESGQFVLDRRRHADVVEWTWFINSYGDDGVYGQLMNGDKDSFLLAFTLANKTSEYYQVPEYVRLCLHNKPESEKLEHVGILHHNPQGQVAFFHRTSGGKVNPMAPPGQIFNADYTTVPLTAKVAWDMFDGAAESGNYRYPKDRIQAERLSHCTLFKGDQLLYTPSCGADELLQQQEMLPVSVLTDADLQGSQLQVVYDFSNAKFRELQEMMQLSDQQFLKQLAWYR